MKGLGTLNAPTTFLEAAFPYQAVSRLVDADRRSPDPAYGAHRWWARRPPAVLRAVLLAASLPAETSPAAFWAAYRSEEPALAGTTVHDPFLGGGTTLVEAARLGATVTGADIDPLAVTISRHQLDPPSAKDVRTSGQRLLDHLTASHKRMWPSRHDTNRTWIPLHYFTLTRVTCRCGYADHLHRSLVLARSIGKPGSVRRDVAVTAFCPVCLRLHDLDATATTLDCCDDTYGLDHANYSGTRYACARCGARSSHEELVTARAPRTLVAVEELEPPSRAPREGFGNTGRTLRRLRPPTAADKAAITTAEKVLRKHLDTHPAGEPAYIALIGSRTDRRPVSFGVQTIEDLHTARQYLYLTEAFAWIAANVEDAPLARAMRLAVSTTVATSNRLCGYATDYGRLSALFTVRAFSLPWLTVELNPLNTLGGRGTLSAAIERVARSCDNEVRRHVLNRPTSRTPAPVIMTLPRANEAHAVTVADATDTAEHLGLPDAEGPADAVAPAADAQAILDAPARLTITDPPYFDFIAYDALSQVFRAWLSDGTLAGEPLLPRAPTPNAAGGVEPADADDFGARLGLALGRTCTDNNSLVAFTYKGGQDAWDAVGIALDKANLRVTALWPVLADPHMGHHTHEGNCEYDLLLVARPHHATKATNAPTEPADMVAALRDVRRISGADIANIGRAHAMASTRWGTQNEHAPAARSTIDRHHGR